jgi:Amt family ammonium transporter
VWSGEGWLFKLGALDFAGGTVVHLSAGASALVAALMLGARKDFGRAGLVPHNVPFVVVGAGLLWFGWFGFNAGSALAANGVAALAFTNTNTAAAAALVTWAMLDMSRGGKVTAVGAATGVVVGLVGITPAAGFVSPMGAIAIGVLCAGLSYTAIQFRSKSKLDDSLDVFACHGLAGLAGALLTGVFATTAANPDGVNGLLAGNPGQLGIQAIAVLAAAALAVIVTFVILKVLKATMGLRASVRSETTGLDLAEHGEEAYFGWEGGTLAGPGTALGQGVVLTASTPAAEQATPAR